MYNASNTTTSTDTISKLRLKLRGDSFVGRIIDKALAPFDIA